MSLFHGICGYHHDFSCILQLLPEQMQIQRNTAVLNGALYLNNDYHWGKGLLRYFLPGFPAQQLSGNHLYQMNPAGSTLRAVHPRYEVY